LARVLEASTKEEVCKMKLVLASVFAWIFVEGITAIALRNTALAAVTTLIVVVLGTGYLAEKFQK